VLPGRPEEDTLQVVAVVETEAVLDRTAVKPQLHSQVRYNTKACGFQRAFCICEFN
jgi:hypothetical protein